MLFLIFRLFRLFLSTLSLRRATMIHPHLCNAKPNFYPRSPCGERLILPMARLMELLFLSTLSLRRATLRVLDGSKSSIISIHALLAESDVHYDNYNLHCVEISIHALLAESDVRSRHDLGGRINFYPRSPCGERLSSSFARITSVSFLSTLSLRRATITTE